MEKFGNPIHFWDQYFKYVEHLTDSNEIQLEKQIIEKQIDIFKNVKDGFSEMASKEEYNNSIKNNIFTNGLMKLASETGFFYNNNKYEKHLLRYKKWKELNNLMEIYLHTIFDFDKRSSATNTFITEYEQKLKAVYPTINTQDAFEKAVQQIGKQLLEYANEELKGMEKIKKYLGEMRDVEKEETKKQTVELGELKSDEKRYYMKKYDAAIVVRTSGLSVYSKLVKHHVLSLGNIKILFDQILSDLSNKFIIKGMPSLKQSSSPTSLASKLRELGLSDLAKDPTNPKQFAIPKKLVWNKTIYCNHNLYLKCEYKFTDKEIKQIKDATSKDWKDDIEITMDVNKIQVTAYLKYGTPDEVGNTPLKGA